MRQRVGLVLLMIGLTCGAYAPTYAACTYNPATNTIHITDFPAEFPCTPQTLLRVDRMNDWNRVSYEGATDTVTVNASLCIGLDNGTDTYFQIGSKEHPREVLVVRGNVTVHPYFVKERSGPRHLVRKCVNRLTIGSADQPAIQAALKIHSEKGQEHGLFVGLTRDADGKVLLSTGGQLHVYNSTVTAAVQDKDHAFAGGDDPRRSYFGGRDEIVLKNSTFSWFAGLLTYAGNGPTMTIEDCTFENGDYAIVIPRRLTMKRCVFRNLQCAIYDYGRTHADLIECVFRDNLRNWRVLYNGKLHCIDCDIGKPQGRDLLQLRKDAKTGEIGRGVVTISHHVIVEVVDPDGRPVPGAAVRISSEQNAPDTVINGHTVTGPDGRTPGRDAAKPILLAQQVLTATDDHAAPSVVEHSYTVRIAAKGFEDAKQAGFQPRESWQTVRLTLRRKP